MEYRIWCEVWGGATGHREDWLKDDGNVATFATREEAEAEAAQLNTSANGNPHRKANFSYTVREVPVCASIPTIRSP
jgi:hypothetical protein